MLTIHSYIKLIYSSKQFIVLFIMTNLPDAIILDVGGKMFKTSKSTLLKYNNNFFATLLSSSEVVQAIIINYM